MEQIFVLNNIYYRVALHALRVALRVDVDDSMWFSKENNNNRIYLHIRFSHIIGVHPFQKDIFLKLQLIPFTK